MNGSFGFIESGALWALALLVPLVAGCVALERHRAGLMARLGRSIPPRWSVVYGPLLVVALGLVALARPHTGFEDVRVPGAGRDIFLLVDVSRSMLADDVSPNRLGIAKRKVADIIDRVARTSPGDRLGIVLFAGDAYLFCPLTADYTVVRAFANAIAPELISTGGSALTAALEIVVGSVDTTKSRHPLVLLFTDGEEASLDPERIGAALKRRTITVNPLAIGTPEGRALVGPEGRFYRDSGGQIVISRLNLAALESIARLTDGSLRRPTVNDTDITALLRGGRVLDDRLDLESAPVGGRTVRTYHEVGPLFAGGMLAVLLAGLALGRLRPVVWGLTLCLLPGYGSSDQGKTPSAYDGARSYAAGRYGDAITALQGEVKRRGSTWALHQGLASAHYRVDDFARAIEEFDRAENLAHNGRERFESLYGRGNARFRRGEFAAAIRDYDAALRIKPGDGDATFNRELARKMLEDKPPPPSGAESSPPSNAPREEQNSSNTPETNDRGEGSDPRGAEKKEPESERPSGDPTTENSAESGDHERTETETAPETGDDAAPQEGEAASTSGQSPSDLTEADASREAGRSNGGDRETAEAEDAGAERAEGGSESPSASPPTAAGSAGSAEGQPPGGGATDPKSWLQSLGEAPVLLERRGARGRHTGEQQW